MNVQATESLSDNVVDNQHVVLIIDDNPADIEFYRRYLARDGFTVLSATCGEQGLRKLAHGRVDCVLLDYNMPDHNGLTVLSQIVNDPLQPQVPVILLTGVGREDVAVNAWRTGAADYLSKSYAKPEDIRAAVENAISSARLRDELVEHTVELRETNRRLRVQSEQTRRFYQGLSHELKTPLSACRELVSLVHDGVEGQVNTKQANLLDLALESCDQLSSQVNDLLDLTRIELGRLKVVQRPFNVDRVFARAVASAMPNARERGVTVRFSRPEGLPRAIGDENRIVQVITNLLNNAVNATPGDGTVVLSAEHLDDHVRILVTDQGCGIEDCEQTRIFERLYQVDPNHADQGGLGLGLAIAQELVRLHDSRIYVKSKLSEGSTFSFTLRCESLFIGREPLNDKSAAC